MLLRITHITGGSSSPTLSPETLHTCLATADQQTPTQTQTQPTQGGSTAAISLNENNDGEILSVGRRNCTITLEDKCVSRRHASVRLLSRSSESSQATAGVEFGVPETEEEAAACDASESGIVAVLKDCGSKFGTFVEMNEESNKQSSAKNDDETGDETDDEAAINVGVELSENQKKAIRLFGQNAFPKFQKMSPNASTILPLSNKPLTILFGPQGSAIRITRIPLRFTFSRLSTKESDRLLSRLPSIGATYAPQWDRRSTHLITKESKATAKHIMAWASCKPAVTQDWVLALLTRENCRDAMPKEVDYVPPGSSQLNEPLSGPCRALKGYRIACLVEDDSAPLAESAGADVLRVYDESPTETEFASWWEGQIARAKQDKMALVVMETTSRKATTWMKAISSLECRCTNQKNLAKAITAKEGDERLLLDVNKVVIEKVVGWEEEREEMVVEWGEGVEEVSDEAEKVEEKDDDATDDGEAEKMVSTRRSKRTQEDVQEEPAAEETVTEESQPKSKRRKKSNDVEVASSREKRSCEEPQDTSEIEEEAAPVKKTAKTKPAKEPTNSKEKPKATPANEPTERVINDEESCDESLPDERIPLPVTDDGWFIAAPAARKNYRKKIDDIEAGEDEERPRQAAKTARVSGLIVRQYVPLAPRTAIRRNNKKDFKRFRKNHVIRGFTSFADGRNTSAPRIRLVSVLPKESERQRQLEMQQAQLEREEERVDALFREEGSGRGGGRKSGSITGFLTQSSTKRGRSRR